MLSIKQLNTQQRPKFILNFSLTYGVGNTRLNKTTKKLGINPRLHNTQTKKKTNIRIENFFRRFCYTFHLRNKIKKNISFLWFIRSYRGFRNRFSLPSRGQRTKTNARTKKLFKTF